MVEEGGVIVGRALRDATILPRQVMLYRDYVRTVFARSASRQGSSSAPPPRRLRFSRLSDEHCRGRGSVVLGARPSARSPLI